MARLWDEVLGFRGANRANSKLTYRDYKGILAVASGHYMGVMLRNANLGL